MPSHERQYQILEPAKLIMYAKDFNVALLSKQNLFNACDRKTLKNLKSTCLYLNMNNNIYFCILRHVTIT